MRSVIVLLLSVWLLGCGSKKPPMKIYTLNATSHTDIENIKSVKKWKTIKVMYSRSLKEKIGYKMRYSYSASEQGTYQNSQWSNDVGKLLQGVFIQILEDSRKFKAVLPYTSTLREDYRLESNIFEFSHYIRGVESYAIISIQFNFINVNTGELIKSKKFSYKEPTLSLDAKGYAEASNKVIVKLSKDLIKWL
jgi:cholesterol transport system auxiliary component